MKRLLLIIALMVSLGCAGASAKSETPVERERCFTLENRTNQTMRLALCRENGEFFFVELFEPLEIKQACDAEVGPGKFLFCWQEMSTLALDCLSFSVGEEHVPTLYDEEVDIWVEPLNKQNS